MVYFNGYLGRRQRDSVGSTMYWCRVLQTVPNCVHLHRQGVVPVVLLEVPCVSDRSELYTFTGTRRRITVLKLDIFPGNTLNELTFKVIHGHKLNHATFMIHLQGQLIWSRAEADRPTTRIRKRLLRNKSVLFVDLIWWSWRRRVRISKWRPECVLFDSSVGYSRVIMSINDRGEYLFEY